MANTPLVTFRTEHTKTLDAEVARLNASHPIGRVTRADLINECIRRYFANETARKPATPNGSRS